MVRRMGWWPGAKQKGDWLQTEEGGHLSQRILVNCYQGQSRTRRKLHKAPTKEFLLYLKKAAEALADDSNNKYDFEGCCVAEIVRHWLDVLCGCDFKTQDVKNMLIRYHKAAVGYMYTKVSDKLKSYLNEAIVVSPTACELHVLTALLQDSKGKIDVSLEDLLRDARAQNSLLRFRIRELENTDAKAEAAREQAAESQAEAAAALEEMCIAEEAMTALAGLPDAGAKL